MIGVVKEENFDHFDYVALISFVYDDRKVYEHIIHAIHQNLSLRESLGVGFLSQFRIHSLAY